MILHSPCYELRDHKLFFEKIQYWLHRTLEAGRFLAIFLKSKNGGCSFSHVVVDIVMLLSLEFIENNIAHSTESKKIFAVLLCRTTLPYPIFS